MIEINIKISEIDYGNLAEQILPIALEKLKEYDGDNILIKSAGMMNTFPKGIASAVLSALPQKVKNELAVHFINKHKEDIVAAVNDFAEKKQIKISIEDVEVHS